MRVLVACEFSGIVRDAFKHRGHEAWSCDFLPTEVDGNHFQMGIRQLLLEDYNWDMMICHPPCTFLASSGARWFQERLPQQNEALRFVEWLLARSIPRIALENPVGVISSRIRKPDQIIQPWMFGFPTTKATCLWLKGLPNLKPTYTKPKRVYDLVHSESPSPDRWRNRSRTCVQIADAMAKQWG